MGVWIVRNVHFPTPSWGFRKEPDHFDSDPGSEHHRAPAAARDAQRRLLQLQPLTLLWLDHSSQQQKNRQMDSTPHEACPAQAERHQQVQQVVSLEHKNEASWTIPGLRSSKQIECAQELSWYWTENEIHNFESDPVLIF